MKSFKKFIALTLLPIILIAVVSVMVTQSFDDVTQFRINFFITGYFLIISFSYVYVLEKLEKRNLSKILLYGYSIPIVTTALFFFSMLTSYIFFSTFNLKAAVFQSILGICIFLTISFAFEIYKQTKLQNVLKIHEKPTFFLKLIVIVTFILSFTFFILTADSFLDLLSVMQVADLIVKIIVFELTVTVVSFLALFALYNFLFFRKNSLLGILLASLISGFVVLYLTHFLNRYIFVGYAHIFVFTSSSCLVMSTITIYRNKLQNLSLSFIKKESEYKQLKNQVNPHFLFNNLNVLISFIESNPKKAIDFGHHLANIYRYYLQNENEDFVLLKNEIEFTKNYIAIFKAKFENGFSFEIENEANENQYILANCLQELIDNIFKHNIMDVEVPVKIKVAIYDNELSVKNTKHHKEANYSTLTGIENINKRYQILVQKSIVILDDQKFFEVKIPVVTLY